MTSTHVRETALAAHAAGLCVLPPNAGADSSKDAKAPLGAWKKYQSERSTLEEIRRWYGNGRLQVGIVCGSVSGNVEALDFDDMEAYRVYVAACRDLGLAELVERIERGYCEDSPVGAHWVYRCDVVTGNAKLANRPDGKTKIETRGEGGYLVISPTTGLHPNGAGYVLRSGSFATIASITIEEREELHNVARLLDEAPPRENLNGVFGDHGDSGTLRPGDDFNARGDWGEALPGWARVGDAQGLALWRRPGKDHGWSATTGVRSNGIDLLHVFTASTALRQGVNLTKFSAYAHLVHNGDFGAAARDLSGRGYGAQREHDSSKGKAGGGKGEESKSEAKPIVRPLKPSELISDNPEMLEVLIDGLLRRCEVMNLVAPPKTGKSWLVLQMALSLAARRDWLGRFCTRRCRVLLIDNELHPETLANRITRVAEAMGLQPEDYEDNLEILSLRGKLCTIADLCTYLDKLDTHYDVIILDALYRFLGSDDENSNSETTRRYNALDQIAKRMNAAVVVVHHMSKGSQDGKAVSDLGSGAGAQSRAADCHLALRPETTLLEECLSVESILRSFPPMDQFWIRRDWPLWVVDITFARPSGGKRASVDPESFANTYGDHVPRTKKEIVAKALAGGITRRPAEAALESAITDGFLHAWKIKGEVHKRYATCMQPSGDSDHETTPS